MDTVAIEAVAGRSDRAPQMYPVYFSGCFGWLHTSAAAGGSETAVVLCAGINVDAMTGHRSLRLWADALAAAGFPTLRFDYPGTGDSLDPPGGTEHWVLWQQSIHHAADWLRGQSGASQLVLGGLRLGATLAAVVARQRDDVAGLVLLAPVMRGRTFMRQLAVEAKMHDPSAQEAGGVVLHELHLSAHTVGLISQVELAKIALPAGCRVAVFAEAASPVLSGCLAAWRSGGAMVESEDFAGLEAMLRPVFMNHEASADVGRVARWMCRTFPSGRSLVNDPTVDLRVVELRPPECVETPLRFGPQGRLFGMLCRPDDDAAADLVVVICNSSGDPHSGFARSAVDLARRLAAAGIASLRMDFAGLGDSVAEGDVGTHVFEVDRRGEFSAAIDALSALGFRRFAIEGLCSGAYHAFHAAVADPRVSALVLVNIPLFAWQVGLPVEHLRHVVERPSHFLQKIFDKNVWRQFLRGEMDLRARLATQGVWLLGKLRLLGWRAAGLVGIRRPANVAQQGMAVLAGRTRTLFLSGAGDASEVTLAEAFGRGGVPARATLLVVPGLDHALTSPAMQALAAEKMIAFLKDGDIEG
jgi:pimeloyl-ACP methyl ester carboxylesterase